MKKLILLSLSVCCLISCARTDKKADLPPFDTTAIHDESLHETEILKFGDLLDTLKKVKTAKTFQKTILDFRLGMSETAYNKAYRKLEKFEYGPGRMAYNMEIKKGELPAACEFIPEFKNGKLNKLTINISNSSTSYSFPELKELLINRYKTKPVVLDYPGHNQDALWIKDGLLAGLLMATEGGIKVDVLSFSYAKDFVDEYKFLDKKSSTKKAEDAF